MGEGIEIRRTPSLCNDEPYLAEGSAVRVKDIVDRVRAGDSPAEVARDFGLPNESVTLLMEVMETGAGQSAFFTAVPCPTCGGACRVHTGDEGTSHYEPVRGTISPQTQKAVRQLWEAATEHWQETDDEGEPIPLARQLWEDSTVLPAVGIKGKKLYRIGVALGFIDE